MQSKRKSEKTGEGKEKSIVLQILENRILQVRVS